MRVGITGASGFIGSSLLPWLARRDDLELLALTRTIPPAPLVAQDSVEWRQGDLASARDCAAWVDGLDAIVHLAHTHTPLTSDDDLPSDATANLVPTLMMLQAIRDAGTRPHVVYASSGGALYTASTGDAPVDESSRCEPTTSYGIQKLAFEHYLRMAARAGWLSATALRIGNAYGVLLPPERLQGFIGVATAQLLRGGPIRIFGDPENVRDYVHLDDICRAIELTLVNRSSFEIYNIGSGIGLSVRDLVALLERVAGRSVPVKYDEQVAGAEHLRRWIVLDSTKAQRELGWTAAVEIEDGMRRLWEEAVDAAWA